MNNEGVPESKTETFDGDFPVVTGIEVDGNWLNKKVRAVIEWKGNKFKRKMADFKWLSKMIRLNSTVDGVSPEYPDEIPSAVWRDWRHGYRKKELNLYLMQCHSLPWIRRYKPYCDIFLESDKNTWKNKRDRFNRDMIQRIKQKKLTYRPKEDVVSTVTNGSGGYNSDEFIMWTDEDVQNERDVVEENVERTPEKKVHDDGDQPIDVKRSSSVPAA